MKNSFAVLVSFDDIIKVSQTWMVHSQLIQRDRWTFERGSGFDGDDCKLGHEKIRYLLINAI